MKVNFPALWIFIAFTAFAYGAEKSKQSLDISIVPNRTKGEQKIFDMNPPSFDVVISNISDAPLSIWKDDCSWGFCCLSFICTYPDGTKISVKRNGIPWDSNWPRPFYLKPGDHFIFHVKLDDRTWPVAWLNGAGKAGIILQPVYEILPHDDVFSKNVKVWIGKATGNAEKFFIGT